MCNCLSIYDSRYGEGKLTMNFPAAFKAKSPSGLIYLGYLSVTMMMITYISTRGFGSQLSGMYLYSLVGLGAVSLVLLAVTCKRLLNTPFDMTLNANSITLNGKTIDTEHIEEILIQGYIRPVIGIKLKGKWLVSASLCYRFEDQEEIGLKSLQQWASNHQVQVCNRSFFRWM